MRQVNEMLLDGLASAWQNVDSEQAFTNAGIAEYGLFYFCGDNLCKWHMLATKSPLKKLNYIFEIYLFLIEGLITF